MYFCKRLLLLILALTPLMKAECTAAFSWRLLNPSSVPAVKAAAITVAMDQAVSAYNFYADYNHGINVSYTSNPNVTAQASYNGGILFGTKINDWTAMHEIAHILGVGTYSQWNNNRNPTNNRWTGAAGIAELEALDGPGAVLHADALHFWPYGNNIMPSSDEGHVRIVGAMREDMGLSNETIVESGQLGDYSNDGTVDAIDYSYWRDRLGTEQLLYNDQSPGETGPVDHAWWKRFYGRTASAAIALHADSENAAVPEPGTLFLLGFAIPLALAKRMHHAKRMPQAERPLS